MLQDIRYPGGVVVAGFVTGIVPHVNCQETDVRIEDGEDTDGGKLAKTGRRLKRKTRT